jgi:predicted RNA-binding protein
MADFPDNREFTGKIVKIDLQAANSPYNNRIFPYG